MKKFKFNKVSIIVLSAVFTLGLLGIVSVFAASPATVNLGTAGNFTVLAKTAVSTTGTTSITGDVGISPAAATFMTGFSETMDASNKFSTSTYVTGKLYASDYAVPTPSYLGTAVVDMQAAYVDAFGRSPGDLITDAGAPLSCATTCDLALQSLVPGVYFFSGPGNVNITDDVTLTGGPTDVWIFRIPGNLNISSGKKVLLSGGAVSTNVFWAVAGTTTLQTTSTFEGNILGGPGASTIAMQNGSILHGKALGQTDVTIIGSTLSSAGGTLPSLTVTKVVLNNNSGNNIIDDFPLFVGATAVVSGVANTFAAGTYAITETTNSNYTQAFSGDCDANGNITLFPGDVKACVITNDDIRQSSSSGSGIVYGCKDPAATNYNYFSSSRPELCIYGTIPPILSLIKVPTPLALPLGPGPVSYSYTLRNVGTVPVNTISVTDNFCSPLAYVSGDTNLDAKLDTNETWLYNCLATLSNTTTNTATATGWANGISTTDVASATVIVGDSTIPPLINVTKVPSPLSLLIGWGLVNYTETITNPGVVPLSNVTITDDKCSPVNYVSGDVNNDGLLDPNEAWKYTCGVMLNGTTTNTVRVSGQANGITATDFAIATVVAYVPGLPITGFPPREIGIMIVFGLMAGIIMLISTSIIALKKKKF